MILVFNYVKFKAIIEHDWETIGSGVSEHSVIYEI